LLFPPFLSSSCFLITCGIPLACTIVRGWLCVYPSSSYYTLQFFVQVRWRKFSPLKMAALNLTWLKTDIN
jgi:hypothetical protein